MRSAWWTLTLITGFVAMVGCAKDEPEVTEPTQQMIDVMTDLYLAEMPMGRVTHSKKDSLGRLLRNKIAEEHGMTGEELEAMVAEIQLNQELNIILNDSVLNRLETLERRYEKTSN